MIEKLFGGDTYLAATRALDAAALRQQVFAHNIANVNTPGYKRQEVQFESALNKALEQAHNPCTPAGCSPVSDIRPQVVTINNTSERADGNNVNLETESVNLAINELKFSTLTQSVGGTFRSLKMVIEGR